MNADFLEDATFHHRHAPAAALTLFPLPILGHEASRLMVGEGAGKLVLQLLELGADRVTQAFEPGSRRLFLCFNILGQSFGKIGSFHALSPTVRAAGGPRFVPYVS